MDTVDPFAELAAKSAAPSDRVLSALREEVRVDTKPRQSLSRAKRTWFSVIALALGFTLTTVKVVGHSPTAFVVALAACSLSIGALLFSGVIPGNGGTSVGTRRTLLGVSGSRDLHCACDQGRLLSASWAICSRRAHHANRSLWGLFSHGRSDRLFWPDDHLAPHRSFLARSDWRADRISGRTHRDRERQSFLSRRRRHSPHRGSWDRDRACGRAVLVLGAQMASPVSAGFGGANG